MLVSEYRALQAKKREQEKLKAKRQAYRNKVKCARQVAKLNVQRNKERRAEREKNVSERLLANMDIADQLIKDLGWA